MKYEKKKATSEEDIQLRETIRNRIIELRTAYGYTQTEFGEIFGKSKTGVASWESGNSLPDIQTLYKISSFFGKDLAYMYGEKGSDFLVDTMLENPETSDLMRKLNEKNGLEQIWVTEGEKRLIEEIRECGPVVDEKVLEEMFNKILRYKADNTNPIDVDEPMVFEIRATQYLGKKK